MNNFLLILYNNIGASHPMIYLQKFTILKIKVDDTVCRLEIVYVTSCRHFHHFNLMGLFFKLRFIHAHFPPNRGTA